ncbi:MAG: Ig-like domain-containing protein [Bacteroidota bacterium]|nr:Ig-like domain-containing protein [Bacteroidota bacterium]
MLSYKLFFYTIILISIFSLTCKETVIEYRDTDQFGKPLTNDQFHGDIVGRVLQKQSGAVVYLSQVSIIDSAAINSNDGSFAFKGVRLGNYDMTIRAENYRIYKRCNLVVPGGGVLYAGDIDLSTVPDLIAQHYPARDDEIVYSNRFARISISFLFTQPMDRLSIEKALSTNPPSKGIFQWGRYIYSPTHRYYDGYVQSSPINPGAEITTFSKITAVTYILSPKDCYVDTTYTVTLSTEAHDTAGNHLRFPLTFSFKTVQAGYTIYGIQTDPLDGDIDVSPISYSSIRLTFPRRMDPVSTEAALTTIPNDDRIVLWPSGNQMTIYMGGIFRTDTLYQITIDSTAKDLDGNKLGEQFSFSFRTAPLRISYTNPGNGQLFVDKSKNISMGFNTYVLKSSVESAFSINPQVSGIFQYGDGYYYTPKNNVIFVPSTPLIPNKKYTVTLITSVKDMFGSNMKTPYTFSFVTSPE